MKRKPTESDEWLRWKIIGGIIFGALLGVCGNIAAWLYDSFNFWTE